MRLPENPITLRDRIVVWANCEHNPAYREAVKQRCSWDAEFFISCFAYTFDPREDVEVHHLPFILWDAQIEYVQWLEDRIGKGPSGKASDGAVLKSRDSGITWVTLAWLIQKWLFEPGFDSLVGSEKEPKVDNRTKNSHFGKLQYIVERLPGWMLPPGFEMKKHRQKLKLINPANGNTIEGESANPDFGRGGRYRIVVFDEGASWDFLEESWTSSSEAARSRVIISTPKGKNFFWKLVDRGKREGYPTVMEIPWWRHPKKDDAWYEAQKRRLLPEELAQEVDMSFQRSQEGIVYTGIHDVPTGFFPYQPGWPLWCSLDYGYTDNMAIIWWQRNPDNGRVRMIDCYQNSKKPIHYYVPFLLGEMSSDYNFAYTHAELEQISEHALWGRPVFFGDPSGTKKEMTSGKSAHDVLREHGIYIVTNTKAIDFQSRKTATMLGLQNLEINLPACQPALDALENARYPERSEFTRATAPVKAPIHDWTADLRAAVEYFFVNLPPFHRISRPSTTRRTRPWQKMYR